jgi:hypothetical protein
MTTLKRLSDWLALECMFCVSSVFFRMAFIVPIILCWGLFALKLVAAENSTCEVCECKTVIKQYTKEFICKFLDGPSLLPSVLPEGTTQL